MKEKEYLTLSHNEILYSLFKVDLGLDEIDSKRKQISCSKCDVIYKIDNFIDNVLNNIITSNDLKLKKREENVLSNMVSLCIQCMTKKVKISDELWNKLCFHADGRLEQFNEEKNRILKRDIEMRKETKSKLMEITDCKAVEKEDGLYLLTPRGEFKLPFNVEKLDKIKTEVKNKIKKEMLVKMKMNSEEEKQLYLIVKKDLEVFIEKDEIISNIKGVLGFSREAIILYTILFDYYMEHQKDIVNNKLFISFNGIHCMYRGKKLNKFGYIDRTTLKSYIRAFLQLTQKNVRLENCTGYLSKYSECGISQRLVSGTIIKTDNNKYRGIEFDLGTLGEVFSHKRSRRMSGTMPISLIRSEYNQINKLQIGMYISRMIFINNRKTKVQENKKYNLSIKSILDNIMAFGENGCAECKTLYVKLMDKDEDPKLKWKLLKIFKKTLKDTLQEFVTYKKIKDFNVPEIKLKDISKKEVAVEIILN